jgi:hypothetical protein
MTSLTGCSVQVWVCRAAGVRQRRQPRHQHGHGPDSGEPACTAGLGSTAPRLKVISPGRYPDVNGPPCTRSSNSATAAAATATEPSHHLSAAVGTARAFAAHVTADKGVRSDRAAARDWKLPG